MNKLYYLKTCDTCKRIIAEWKLPETILLREIKETPITVKELEVMHQLSGSFEALFSKRAKLYKERDLKNQDLSEIDIKQLLLEHYTFLKRPVLLYNEQIFIGNSKKNIQQVKEVLANG